MHHEVLRVTRDQVIALSAGRNKLSAELKELAAERKTLMRGLREYANKGKEHKM